MWVIPVLCADMYLCVCMLACICICVYVCGHICAHLCYEVSDGRGKTTLGYSQNFLGLRTRGKHLEHGVLERQSFYCPLKSQAGAASFWSLLLCSSYSHLCCVAVSRGWETPSASISTAINITHPYTHSPSIRMVQQPKCHVLGCCTCLRKRDE